MYKTIAITALAVTLAAVPCAHADAPGPLVGLVDAATQRLLTADSVAAVKFRDGGPVEDARREQQVLDTVMTAARDQHVDADYVRGVFRDQIDATVGVEHSLLGRWKLDPASAPVGAPDLAASRSTIDRLNHAMVDEIVANWQTLQSPRCANDLGDAIESVSTARGLDPLYRQALGYATHSYCR